MSAHPSLEELFTALEARQGEALDHARECAECGAVLEEHRQLEKDLFRLADPLPPVTLLAGVMSRVQEMPKPSHLHEVKVGLSILFATVGLAITTFLLGHGNVSSVGSSFASSLVGAHHAALGFSSALATAWHAAAYPVVGSLMVILFVSLVGLRKLTSQRAEHGVKVSG